MPQLHASSLYKSIFVLAAIVLGLTFIYFIHNVILLFIFGAVVAYALNPVIGWLHRRRVPRIASILVVLLVLLSMATVGFSYLIPALIDQVQTIIANIPGWVSAESKWWQQMVAQQPFLASYQLDSQEIVKRMTSVTQTVLEVVGSLLTIVAGLLIALIIGLYALVNPTHIADSVLRMVPPLHQATVRRVAREINVRIGGWLRGIITLSFATMVVTYLVYHFVFHLPYALTLAVVTAMLEIIPIVGPITAAIIAGASAFMQEPMLGVYVVLFYTSWRFTTDYWLTPKIMGTHVGLHPLTIIFAVLAMAELFGAIGLFLAIPTAATIKIIIEEVYIPHIHKQQAVPDEA